MIAVAWDGRMGVVHEARRDSSSGRVKMGRAPPGGILGRDRRRALDRALGPRLGELRTRARVAHEPVVLRKESYVP